MISKHQVVCTICVCAILFVFDTTCLSQPEAAGKIYRDVNNISFRGNSVSWGMKITSSNFSNGAFLVETTGARFEYASGILKVYQGLSGTKRLLSTITFDQNTPFERVVDNDDHVLLWSEKLNIGVYGDSTCIIAPRTELAMSCKGNFKPDFEARYKGELLLIDNLGGIEIYPQRYEAGYEITNIELGKKDWLANYRLKANERVMLAAFPGKPFDWDASFKSNLIVMYGSMGYGIGNVYGQMPPESTIAQWSKNLHIIYLSYQGLYKNYTKKKYGYPGGPYTVANEAEFRRFVKTAHSYNLKISPYTSLYYHQQINPDREDYYQQVKALKEQFDIDGVFVDGLLPDLEGYKMDDKCGRWEMIRRLRQLFGNGPIVYHTSNKDIPFDIVPNVDVYASITLTGENVPFQSVDDPYVKYAVRKYGISNTVGMWVLGKHPDTISPQSILDAEISMNCRKRWGSYIPIDKAPDNNKYKWGTKIDGGYSYYLKKLAILKKQQH